MIIHIKVNDLILDSQPLTPDEGQGTTADKKQYDNSERGLEVGIWEFSGMQRIPEIDELLEVLFVSEGSLEISADGQTHVASAGDILIFESPIAAQEVRSSGFRAVYVIRRQVTLGSKQRETAVTP